MKKSEILKLLYVTKDYSKLKKICSKHNDDEWYKNILAKVFFNEQKYNEAAKLFYEMKMFYESGYCLLMQGDLFNAKRLWDTLDDSKPIYLWGKSLLGFIEKKPAEIPTYFQIRNFLEQDLDALLTAKLTNYAENLINSIDLIAQVNSESYKYMARVLFNHKYFDISKSFLQQSKDIYYKDPETHFLLAKICLEKNEIEEAKTSLNDAIRVNEDYFPAKNLLLKIK